MDAASAPQPLPVPDRELSPLERAIQSFNAGSDPSAGALQRAFLDGRVAVLSASEVGPDGVPDGMRLYGLGEPGDEAYLAVFTHEDRVSLDVGKRFPWMVNTGGANVLDMTTGGITVNPGSDASLAVAVKGAGVQEMRDLAAARSAATEARSARAPHEIETAIEAAQRDGMTPERILRFAVDLWPATLFVPSGRPLGESGEIDLDACFTFGPDDERMLAVFTDRDQLGDFAAAQLLETSGGGLVHRLPEGAGILFNPQRPDQLGLSGAGLQLMATIVERRVPPGAADS